LSIAKSNSVRVNSFTRQSRKTGHASGKLARNETSLTESGWFFVIVI
jgi:hypothetical protein